MSPLTSDFAIDTPPVLPLPRGRRIKVLVVHTWMPVGGVEKFLLTTLPRLDPKKFEVHLGLLRERGPLANEMEAAGVPVHVLSFRSRFDPFGLWRLRRLIKQHRFDVVHGHMYRANCPVSVMKWLMPHLKTCGTYHNVNTWQTARQQRVDGRLFGLRDVNLAVSRAVRADVVKRLGKPAEAVRVLYNCVDTEVFRPAGSGTPAERHARRREMGYGAEHCLIGMVARLVPQKNQAGLIRTAAKLARSAPNVRVLLFGDGPDRVELEQLAASLGLPPGVVQFMGRRDDMPALLPALDIFCLPSFKEGFSIAILEAMACGLPVVASDVGGAGEIIESSKNGCLVEVTPSPDVPGLAIEVNEQQLERHLRRLATDPALRHAYGQAARRTAETFSIPVIVSEYERLYRNLVEG